MTQALTQKKTKLSVIRKGYWRNKFRCARPTCFRDGSAFEPGEHLSPFRWPTAELAEQKVHEDMRKRPHLWEAEGMEYLGPVFFPEEP